MHHDRRPAALILLGVTETDALHLPVLVTNLKCALECSWQDPRFEISRLGGGHLAWADPVWSTRLSPTCLAARIAHRASPESSRQTW